MTIRARDTDEKRICFAARQRTRRLTWPPAANAFRKVADESRPSAVEFAIETHNILLCPDHGYLHGVDNRGPDLRPYKLS